MEKREHLENSGKNWRKGGVQAGGQVDELLTKLGDDDHDGEEDDDDEDDDNDDTIVI